jgi:polyferredoxin
MKGWIRVTQRKRYRWLTLFRYGIMGFFFLFLLHVAYEHQLKGGGPRGTPSVEAYCPFGGLASLYQFLTTGGFIRRIEPSAIIVFGALVILTIFASSGFCGWICPFGSLQEWMGLLGKRVFRKKFNPTGVWEQRLRYLKYVILAVVTGLTWKTASLVFRDYDPFLAFFHLGYHFDELAWAYAALAVVLVGSIYIERFFCKYACPLGAVVGLLGKLGRAKIVRTSDGCKECNICRKVCYAHIDLLSVTEIRDAGCNHCLKCVAACPKPNVLTVRASGFRIPQPVYASVLVIGLFVLIGVSKVAGKWQTKPASLEFTNAAGQLDAEQIRGWMNLQEVSAGYGISLDRLYSSIGLPSQVRSTEALNRIAGEYNVQFNPERVREAVLQFLAGKPEGQVSGEAGSKRERGRAGGGQEIRGSMK